MDPRVKSKTPTDLGRGEALPADEPWKSSGAATMRRRQIGQPAGEADLAAGPPSRQHITLSAPGWLPFLCRSVPATIMFVMLSIVFVTFCFYSTAYYVVAALLTAFTLSYTTSLCVSCAVGVYRIRSAAARDWHAELQRLQNESASGEREVMHVVLLPNYKENEDMLLHTLEHLGKAPLARDSMYIVLAMEEREGPDGQEKAQRLINKSRHLFADIMASFHPTGLTGEVAGKSSNTQWAYRQMIQRFKREISRLDPSQVFLTVGDADTLWHPQFFSAMSCQALEMPEEERTWAFWQPPALSLRNLFSVPGGTRVSGYGALLFELGCLTTQYPSSHMCFSAYSTTLALTANPLINGWDGDVIAEDHHMFCKCFFASLWEQVEYPNADAQGNPRQQALASKVKLCPVYLPAISYLVESDEGGFASSRARFQQARRHSQGIAEVSYIFLQYAKLWKAAGGLPLRAHASILSIVGKLTAVHFINTMQAFVAFATGAALVPGILAWLRAGGLGEILATAAADGVLSTLRAQNFGGIRWALAAIFGPVPTMIVLMSTTTFLIIRDILDGRVIHSCEDVQRPADAAAPKSAGLSRWQRLRLWVMILADYLNFGEVCLIAYCFVPAMMAAWSLVWHGSKFEYIVAAKPK